MLFRIKDSVILQLKEQNQPVETYYGFNPQAVQRIKSAWEWEAEAELIAIANTVQFQNQGVGALLPIMRSTSQFYRVNQYGQSYNIFPSRHRDYLAAVDKSDLVKSNQSKYQLHHQIDAATILSRQLAH